MEWLLEHSEYPLGYSVSLIVVAWTKDHALFVELHLVLGNIHIVDSGLLGIICTQTIRRYCTR